METKKPLGCQTQATFSERIIVGGMITPSAVKSKEEVIMLSIKKRQARFREYCKAYSAFIALYPFTAENLFEEKWLYINPCYQISSYGRVKSFCKGKIKILKPLLSNGGYLYVPLYNGERKSQDNFFIHRLVADFFIPNPESKPQVNHVDGCKFNNYVGNLAWCTVSENQLHALAMGLKKTPRGEENYQAGVSNLQAEQIRAMYIPYSKEFGTEAIGKMFGLNGATVRNIVQGKSYKTAGGKRHEKTAPRPRVPEEIRQKIRDEYIKKDKEHGALALGKKYGINYHTVLIIVQENS